MTEIVRIQESSCGHVLNVKLREIPGREKPKGKNAVAIRETRKAKATSKPVYRRVKPKQTLTERLDAADARLGLKDGEPTQLDARLDEIDKDYLG